MKRFVLLFVFVCVYAISYAQMCVATLQHNDTISAFYGSNAFVEAHAAAANGDIITLSSGDFNGCNITKAITLHGAGYLIDTVAYALPTKINGSFNISNAAIFIIENVSFTGQISLGNTHDPQFIKCYINNLYCWYDLYNVQFINCIIGSWSNVQNSNTGNIMNSVIWNCNNVGSMAIYNSFVRSTDSNRNYPLIYNSIINVPELSSNSLAYNCIGIRRSDHSVFQNIAFPDNNMDASSFEDVFETYTGGDNLNLNEQYILREDVASGFLGTDYTEVGIHGGMMPFDIPLDQKSPYIMIKRCNVASKTTVDDKLSIDIEVMTNNEE